MLTQSSSPSNSGTFFPLKWDPNNWETPDPVAAFVGSRLFSTDHVIIEPGAGRGQLVKYLPDNAKIYAYETNPERLAYGRKAYPYALWRGDDFLSAAPPLAHVVVSNPPFEYGAEFLVKALACLNPEYRLARCLFLLPVDYWQSQRRCDVFRGLDAHIHRVYALRGRIAYLKDGIPHSNRQCYDALFDIRPGRKTGGLILIDLDDDRNHDY